jgi:hypothetical protein
MASSNCEGRFAIRGRFSHDCRHRERGNAGRGEVKVRGKTGVRPVVFSHVGWGIRTSSRHRTGATSRRAGQHPHWPSDCRITSGALLAPGCAPRALPTSRPTTGATGRGRERCRLPGWRPLRTLARCGRGTEADCKRAGAKQRSAVAGSTPRCGKASRKGPQRGTAAAGSEIGTSSGHRSARAVRG